MSLNELHRQSCVMLKHELKQLGFDVSGGALEQDLYPHYLSHPIGLGNPTVIIYLEMSLMQ